MGYKFRKMWKVASKLPRIKFSRNNLCTPGMFLPGDPGGINLNKERFWTATDICDLGQQGDLYRKNYSKNTKVLKISKL